MRLLTDLRTVDRHQQAIAAREAHGHDPTPRPAPFQRAFFVGFYRVEPLVTLVSRSFHAR
jgi:hypothetical protein